MRVLGLVVAGMFCVGANAQWTLEESHTTASLRGIHNVGGGVAWASGSNGTVIRTEDGGYLWQTCSMPPGAEKLDFRGIQAFDENTAVVMSSGKGNLSRIYRTTDGCQSWKLVFTNPEQEGFWDAMMFGSKEHGWLLGDPVDGRGFVLLGTIDGGEHWVRVEAKGLQSPTPETGAFAASNSSLISSSGVPSFATGGPLGAWFYQGDGVCTMGIAHDDPASCIKYGWVFDRVELSMAGAKKSAGAFSLAQVNRSFVAVGGDYQAPGESRGTACYSTELAPDGSLWWLAAKTPPHGYRSAVAWDAEHRVWITVGPNGTDVSVDDGKNWRALTPGEGDAPRADRDWNALSLPFAVGPKGRVGRLNANALTGLAAR